MREDKNNSQGNIKKEYLVGVAIGLTVAFICFICGSLWVTFNPFNGANTDDNSSSSPSQSIESSPASSETLIPEFTSTSVPTPTQTTPHTQTPAQNPTPIPTPTTTPTPVFSEDLYNNSASPGWGMNPAGDGPGEAQESGEAQEWPLQPNNHSDWGQDVITGSIPEPPIED